MSIQDIRGATTLLLNIIIQMRLMSFSFSDVFIFWWVWEIQCIFDVVKHATTLLFSRMQCTNIYSIGIVLGSQERQCKDWVFPQLGTSQHLVILRGICHLQVITHLRLSWDYCPPTTCAKGKSRNVGEIHINHLQRRSLLNYCIILTGYIKLIVLAALFE